MFEREGTWPDRFYYNALLVSLRGRRVEDTQLGKIVSIEATIPTEQSIGLELRMGTDEIVGNHALASASSPPVVEPTATCEPSCVLVHCGEMDSKLGQGSFKLLLSRKPRAEFGPYDIACDEPTFLLALS